MLFVKKLILLTLFLAQGAIAQDCFFCFKPMAWPWKQSKWPVEYVKIHEVTYERSEKATFCKRPEDMVDTIVLHHSETPNTDTPERINQYHLARGSKEDPWYMIAYSYVINAPYAGSSTPAQKVSEGRPMDIVGAHAGSNAFVPMDEDQKKMWEEGKVKCGKEGYKDDEFKVDPNFVKDGKIKANVTTIGLVVNGNYAPFSKVNPNGYSAKNPRYPTADTQDLIARTSCQLQKRYPRIKNIKWHNMYNATTCPGNIKAYVPKIIELARKYGCEFQ